MHTLRIVEVQQLCHLGRESLDYPCLLHANKLFVCHRKRKSQFHLVWDQGKCQPWQTSSPAFIRLQSPRGKVLDLECRTRRKPKGQLHNLFSQLLPPWWKTVMSFSHPGLNSDFFFSTIQILTPRLKMFHFHYFFIRYVPDFWVNVFLPHFFS